MLETILYTILGLHLLAAVFFFGRGYQDRLIGISLGLGSEAIWFTLFRALIWPVGLLLDLYDYLTGYNDETDY